MYEATADKSIKETSVWKDHFYTLCTVGSTIIRWLVLSEFVIALLVFFVVLLFVSCKSIVFPVVVALRCTYQSKHFSLALRQRLSRRPSLVKRRLAGRVSLLSLFRQVVEGKCIICWNSSMSNDPGCPYILYRKSSDVMCW